MAYLSAARSLFEAGSKILNEGLGRERDAIAGVEKNELEPIAIGSKMASEEMPLPLGVFLRKIVHLGFFEYWRSCPCGKERLQRARNVDSLTAG
jgi:hypothetical protein